MTVKERSMMTRARTQSTNSEDGAWEDIPKPKPSPLRPSTRRSSSPAASLQSVPRKRRAANKTIFVSASPRKQFLAPTPTKLQQKKSPSPKPPPTPDTPKEEWADVVFSWAKHIGKYLLDVFTTSVWLLRKPLSFVLFLWLLAFIVVRVHHTLRAAFAPLCYVPGISRSALCRSDLDERPPQWADYPKLVDVQSATFEQLLDESVGGSGLALEIKKAEMATADLNTLVRVSNLKSRDLIAESLSEFIEDAKSTGRGLQKLSSKVGGAVDGILAVNDYALHTIEEAASKEPSRFSLNAIIPFSKRPANEVVTQTFTEAMDVLSASMRRLIIEAEVSLANLDKLEERLSTLHELVSREDSSLSSAKSELLSELWTKLGGNRRTLQGFDEHLVLLKNLGGYRKRALVHVVTALQTLQAMSEDMEDMRERVAAPELVGSSIPVEVHMKSIKSGLERLKEGRMKAREREEEAVRRVLAIESE